MSIVFFLLSPLATPSRAADQVWGFKGTLTSYVAGAGYVELGDVPVGSVVRGQVLFDDATPDADPSSTSGSYPYTTFALALEGMTDLHLGVSGTGALGVKNDELVSGGSALRDEIRLDTGGLLLVPSLTMAVAQLDFHVREDAATPPAVLASDALPAVPPALASFTTEQLLLVIGYVGGDVTNFSSTVDEFGPVGTPDLPLIPDSVTVNTDGSVTWGFSTLGVSLCVTGCWADPAAASGFSYRMTSAALFTGIGDFPTGFGSAIEVSVGGSSLGVFGPGDSVDFTTFPGGGVPAFEVTGLVPSADVSAATAFPLQLVFDTPGATFEMTSIPETSTVPLTAAPALGLALVAAGAVAAGRRLRSRHRR